MESVDKKMRLPTSETRGNFTVLLSTLFLLEIFVDEQCRAVCQGTGLIPTPNKEEEKGPDFSCSNMHLFKHMFISERALMTPSKSPG